VSAEHVGGVGEGFEEFFTFVDKTPTRVTSADVLDFIRAQSTGGDRKVVRIDGLSGVSSRTIRRRVSSVSSFYVYLLARADTSVTRNPVPRGLATRRERSRPRQGVPLVRNVKTLPRVLSPADVDALVSAMRTERDKAMIQAMLLVGCVVARCLGCDSKTCALASVGCLSMGARVVVNG
jgi:integrase/recombinase XerD